MIEKSNILIQALILVLNLSIIAGTLNGSIVLVEDSLLEMCDFGEKEMEDKEEHQEEERKVQSEYERSGDVYNYRSYISNPNLPFVLQALHYLEYPTPPPKFIFAELY